MLNTRLFRFLMRHRIACSMLALAIPVALLLFTPYPASLVRALRHKEPEVRIVERIVEKRIEVPVLMPPEEAGHPYLNPTPWVPELPTAPTTLQLPPYPPALPENLSTGTFEQFTALAQGLHLRSSVIFRPGKTAFAERSDKRAYVIRISLELQLPHAADGRELLPANPNLPGVLQDYDKLMAHARISPWYNALYRHKQNAVRRSLATLSVPLDRHNFFDTDTILELRHPVTHRRALWIQADMDVVSDGSDGDRLPTMPENIRKSSNYQPATSYRWKKRTKTPNPLLAGWEARLAKLKKDRTGSRTAIDNAQRVIYDLKHFSYLLAQYDPFIVIPLTLKEGGDDTYRPRPGDYAVVIVENRVYPAIVGDYGPRTKSGEASLRLAKLINPQSSTYARPVTPPTVSYIIFPHSAEAEPGPINYARLNTHCRELLDELGGLGTAAHFLELEDLLAPKEPTPSPARIDTATTETVDDTTKPEATGARSTQKTPQQPPSASSPQQTPSQPPSNTDENRQ